MVLGINERHILDCALKLYQREGPQEIKQFPMIPYLYLGCSKVLMNDKHIFVVIGASSETNPETVVFPIQEENKKDFPKYLMGGDSACLTDRLFVVGSDQTTLTKVYDNKTLELVAETPTEKKGLVRGVAFSREANELFTAEYGLIGNQYQNGTINRYSLDDISGLLRPETKIRLDGWDMWGMKVSGSQLVIN